MQPVCSRATSETQRGGVPPCGQKHKKLPDVHVRQRRHAAAMQALGALVEDEALVCMMLPLTANRHAPLGLCTRLRAVSRTFCRAVAALRPRVHLTLQAQCAKEAGMFAAAQHISAWGCITGVRTSPVLCARAAGCRVAVCLRVRARASSRLVQCRLPAKYPWRTGVLDERRP